MACRDREDRGAGHKRGDYKLIEEGRRGVKDWKAESRKGSAAVRISQVVH